MTLNKTKIKVDVIEILLYTVQWWKTCFYRIYFIANFLYFNFWTENPHYLSIS